MFAKVLERIIADLFGNHFNLLQYMVCSALTADFWRQLSEHYVVTGPMDKAYTRFIGIVVGEHKLTMDIVKRCVWVCVCVRTR